MWLDLGLGRQLQFFPLALWVTCEGCCIAEGDLEVRFHGLEPFLAVLGRGTVEI